MVFIHNGILATRKNEILSFISKWMELENIILSKVSQAQKAKNHMFSFLFFLFNKIGEQEGRTGSAWKQEFGGGCRGKSW
jgi:hypothetical protein